MRLPQGYRNLGDWLVDLVILAATWIFIFFILKAWQPVSLSPAGMPGGLPPGWPPGVPPPVGFPGGPAGVAPPPPTWHQFYLPLIIILITVANIIWLQLRLTPQMTALAAVHRRQELAVTLINPRSFLIAKLRWPFIRTLAPSVTTLPLLVYLMLTRMDMGWDNISLLVFILIVATAGLAVAIGGAFDLLIRLCRARTVAAMSHFTIPFVWSSVAIGTPLMLYLLLVFFLWIIDRFYYSREVISLFLYGLIFFFTAICAVSAYKHWRKTMVQRQSGSGEASGFLKPLVWSAVTIGAPVAFFFLIGRLFERILELSDTIFAVCFITLIAFLAAQSFVFAIKRWRKAVEAYYRFD